MAKLRDLEKFTDDEEFCTKWRAIKSEKKKKLAEWVKRECKI
jgi:glucan phosphorylase